MSASPSGGPGGPNGQKPTPPPTKLARIRRRNDNPLVAPRRNPPPRPAGVRAPGTPVHAAMKNAPPKPASAKGPGRNGPQSQPNFEEARKVNGGWSFPMPEGATEYPIVLTKKSQREGLRFHIMKLVPPHQKAGSGLDPTDQNQFTRPVTLHRRDPRQPPPGREVKQEAEEETAELTAEQTEESEKQARVKAEKEAQKAIDDAQKAPVMKDPDQQKKSQTKQKEKKPAWVPRTEKQKKETELKYEEALPWHLEDADGKNVFVGQYERPLSDAKVAFIIQPGSFRMVPLEKWYKFTAKRALTTSMTIEEAEKVMGKKAPVSRWALRDAQREKNAQAMEEARIIVNGRVNVKQESSTFQAASRREKMDHDDIDMSGDEFQDDDETAGFEPEKDEDSKESKDRVRREQLGANLFGAADEGEVEKEELAVKKEEEKNKVLGKALRRKLKKRDQQFQYDSDDSERERDPFATSSESETDSDDEKQQNEEDKDKDGKDKAGPAGTSSKGNSTPQGKKAAAEAAKKGKSLKRAGSPLVSDSSGTESTRKKKKTGPAPSSMTGSRSTTPMPGAGSQRRPGAGSTSDGEATGGEMSDGAGGKKRKKDKSRSHLGPGTSSRGTPAGSRAGSPIPASGNNSFTSTKGSGASTPGSPTSIVTVQEIVDALPPPPGSLTILELMKVFRARVGPGPGQMPQSQWIKLVKENASYDNKNKKLSRKQ